MNQRDLEYEKRRQHRKMIRQRQVRRQKMILLGSAVLMAGAVSIIVSIIISKHNDAKEAARLAELEQQKKEEMKQEQALLEANTIHLVAVGDNLIHEQIYESADTSQAVWNYDHLYTHIKEDIAAADLAAVNQECIFVEDHADVSAYPEFGSPTEIGDALVNTGFDIVEHATNHAFDKGTSGIQETLSYWKNAHPDIHVLGIHENQEAADTISTITCKDVTFALLNYTGTINNEDYDALPTYMLDLLRAEKVTADAAKARKAGDMVIAFVHAGMEYSTEPNQDLKNFLQLLLSQGVDIAICSHPHVLQNFETLTDGQGNEMLVYYSLGNFISTQKEPECLLGGMADITISRDPQTGELSVSNSDLVPLVTHYNYDRQEYCVYKLEDYTEELAAEHSIHQETNEVFTLESLKQQYENVLTQKYADTDAL